MTSVYFHINPVKQEVFYVGIGNEKRRPYTKGSRSQYWLNTVNKYGFSVVIVEKNLTWEQACLRERYYIKLFGRKDLELGALVNLTDGGDGAENTIVKKETLKKLSKIRKGKRHSEDTKQKIKLARASQVYSKESREKMRQAQLGKKLSKEHKEKISLGLIAAYRNNKTNLIEV